MFHLYDFSFSHYSEKARWALDFKGIPYTPRHLLPGFHLRTARKLAPRSCLPILEADGAVIQDSTEIINFLEQAFPERSLTPPDPQDAKDALEWEEYLDEEIGVTLRLWFYYYTLPDRDRALRFLCQDAPWPQRSLFALSFATIRRAMTKMMNISAETASAAEQPFCWRSTGSTRRSSEGRFWWGTAFPELTCLHAHCFGRCAGLASRRPKPKRSCRRQSVRFANNSRVGAFFVGCWSNIRNIEFRRLAIYNAGKANAAKCGQSRNALAFAT